MTDDVERMSIAIDSYDAINDAMAEESAYAYEDQMHLYSASFLDDAARERPALTELQTTLAKVAEIDWSKFSSEGIVAKLGRRAKLQRSIDTPVKQRTALDAAHVALARHIENGTFR